MLNSQRAAFFAELPVPLSTRCDRLRRAVALVEENGAAICAALGHDDGALDEAAAMQTQVAPAILVLSESLRGLPSWMRPAAEPNVVKRLLRRGDYVEYQPVGIVGVVVPAELPVLQLAKALAGALAAGNRVTIAFDRRCGALSGLFAELVPNYFDMLELAVAPAGTLFSETDVDLVVAGAAEGGPTRHGNLAGRLSKSPVIIGRSADFRVAADQVIASKLANGGRAALSPDYLLVPEDQEEAIAGWLWRAAMQRRHEVGSAAPWSEADKERLALLLQDARARGGEVMVVDSSAGATHQIPLHIVRHATPDMRLMQEDVRGAILPLCNYRDLEDALRAVHEHATAPTLYYFGQDRAERREVLDRTLSATIAINGRTVASASGGSRRSTPPAPSSGEGEDAFRRFSQLRHVYWQSMPEVPSRPSGDGVQWSGHSVATLH